MSTPAKDPEIPPFRLEDLHGSLKASFRRPRGGVPLVLLLAAAGLAVFLLDSAGQPPVSEIKPAVVRPVPPPAVPRDPFRDTALQAPKEPAAPPPEEKPKDAPLGPTPAGHVRVAAAQMASVFGNRAENRSRIQAIVEKAAAIEVKVLALPEACLSGYADVDDGLYWTKERPGPTQTADQYDERPPAGEDPHETRAVAAVAETREGESVRFCADLARKHGMYLTAPIIEREAEAFYSAVFLLDPKGRAILHWRKKQLWETGDASWATAGGLEPEVAKTPYGRMGLLISYDFAATLPKLEEKKARIILHCCALYGQNFEALFRSKGFLDPVKNAGATLVLANWTARDFAPWWPGYGMSRVILPSGVTKRVRNDVGDALVIADLPLPEKTEE
jgi:predicted amidohydrolase